ncbi:MAG: TATA-box-binding protein [Candidatus Aenigmarchaeota archaeon]|nr:TATA-box-binding protein [Candidatus Aenigmarchaeota archaeon]
MRVENIVASASLGVEVPLEKIVSKMEGMEYEPEQFPGLVYRMTDPKAAALIFGSGKIVCTGARSLDDVKEVFRKVVLIVKKSGAKVPKEYKFQVENIVSSAKLESKLNLDDIAFNLENSEYEPEQFPGLVYRMTEPKVAFLLFGSGKIVITGARSVKDVNTAVEKVSRKLKAIGAFKKETPESIEEDRKKEAKIASKKAAKEAAAAAAGKK